MKKTDDEAEEDKKIRNFLLELWERAKVFDHLKQGPAQQGV